MKTNINLNLTMIVLAVLGVAATWYFGRKGLAAAGQAINPTNPDNVFNQGATAAAQAVDLVPEGRTIGGTIFEGVQAIQSLFTGTPTDNEVVRQQPELVQPRLRKLDGVAP